MALPNVPWTTLYPVQQDTGPNGEDQMPQLVNDSFVGADDGHRALAEHVLALRNKLDAVCKKVGDDSNLPSGSLLDRVLILETAPVDLHASTHESGGSDEISVAGLSGILADPQPALPHKTTHQDGGADEISVAGLSGLLADPQTPTSHATTHEPGGSDEVTGVVPGAHATAHEDGGSDELNVAGLSGELADPQPPKTHVTTHEDGGADELNVGGLSGVLADPQTAAAHALSHEDGGSDEINVGGLSGVLADPQTAAAHATSHENGGADEISVAGLSGELADDQNAKAVRETSGPTLLTVGAVADGLFLKRVGATLVGSPPGTASPLTTKGDLYTYDSDNQRLPVGDGGQMLTPDPAEVTGLKWRNFPAFIEETYQTLGTETPGDPVVFTISYDPFGTDRVDAPQGYDLLVFHDGTKMRYSASPSGSREYGYNPATKEITVVATGTADQYEAVYRTLDDLIIATILSTYGSATFGTDTFGPETTETQTYETASYGTSTFGPDEDDTYGSATYGTATFDSEESATFGSATFGTGTFGG